jgi:type IV pilus assembly protein PilM
MFGSGTIRTGIDLGTSSVKVVRGEGKNRLERITHFGAEDWNPEGSADERAAGALSRLLAHLELGRGRLGEIAVAAGGEEASVREVLLPPLSEAELRRALPYEAKKHLFLENMASPLLDCQILGPGPASEEDGSPQIRVLMAAAPASARDFPMAVLSRVGLEPEVIDLDSLACLNALLAQNPFQDETVAALGLLDLGGRQAFLHITHSQGGVYSRSVGPGAPPGDGSDLIASYSQELSRRLRETITYYRGRFRQEVGTIHVAGGGALLPGVQDHLREAGAREIVLLDPFKGLAVAARQSAERVSAGARFVTSVGLCRWWDGTDV